MKKYKQFSYPMEAEEKKHFETRLIVMAASFTLVLLLSFISVDVSLGGVAADHLWHLLKIFFKKKHP